MGKHVRIKIVENDPLTSKENLARVREFYRSILKIEWIQAKSDARCASCILDDETHVGHKTIELTILEVKMQIFIFSEFLTCKIDNLMLFFLKYCFIMRNISWKIQIFFIIYQISGRVQFHSDATGKFGTAQREHKTNFYKRWKTNWSHSKCKNILRSKNFNFQLYVYAIFFFLTCTTFGKGAFSG